MESSKPKDLAPKRLEQLRSILGQNRVVRVEELTEQLGVSSATIRRDLGELEKLGEVRRVYGGAVSTGGRLDEPLFDDKTSVAAAEKRRIAEAALKDIKPNDTIYLGWRQHGFGVGAPAERPLERYRCDQLAAGGGGIGQGGSRA